VKSAAASTRDRGFAATAPIATVPGAARGRSTSATAFRTPGLADVPALFAVSASSFTNTSGTTANAPHLTAAPTPRSGSTNSSRAAVTRRATAGRGRAKHARTREFGREIAGDDERGRTGAEDMRLTASAADHVLRSAGVGTAHPADVPAAVSSNSPHPADIGQLPHFQQLQRRPHLQQKEPALTAPQGTAGRGSRDKERAT
jgi:hypothetical protein